MNGTNYEVPHSEASHKFIKELEARRNKIKKKKKERRKKERKKKKGPRAKT